MGRAVTLGAREPAGFVRFSDTRARLGESPVWSSLHQAFWWVDIDGRKLLRTGLGGTTDAWETDELPGFVQCIGEAVYVGMESGIFAFDPEAGQFQKVAALGTRGQRFNDACTDAFGRIWTGTMDVGNERDEGELFLFDPSLGTLTARIGGFHMINGLAWDDARKRLFLSDSHPDVQTVWTCRADAQGRLGDRTVFARFHDLDGRPDGAALDERGNYWIAGIGGATLYRFSPDGAEVRRFSVPMRSPTKPAMLMDRGRRSIVLTSRDDDAEGGWLAIWHDASKTVIAT